MGSGFGQAKYVAGSRSENARAVHDRERWLPRDLYEMVGQYGTHVDPPAHFDENGITMDEIPLKQMILPLIVLDNSPYLAKDPNHAFSIDDLKAWERQHGRVPKGAFAALRTDMYKDWDADPERFKRSPFPAWALETIKFLYEERGVTATGHEAWIPTRPTRWIPRRTFFSTAIIRSRSWRTSTKSPRMAR